MTRLPVPTRESLAPDAQAVWDMIAGPRGDVRGPHAMLLHNPSLARAVAALGERLRFQSSLPGAERELAILAAGREIGSRYEFVAHRPIAEREGARTEAIEAVRIDGPLDALTGRERLIIEVVRSLFRARALPDALYARAEAELDTQQLVELVTLAGFYGMIAFVLLGFEVDLPDDVAPPF